MRHVIADEVEGADVSADWNEIILWGPETAAICRQVLAEIPAHGRLGREKDGLFFWEKVGAWESFRLLVPVGAGGGGWERWWAAGAIPVEREEWRRARILAGRPAVPEDLGPGDLPQEGGLENVAVCYTKGCYLGQEVANRLKNIGQVRRRLHVVQGSGAPPAPHAPLYQAGRKIGEIRSAAKEAGGFAALAMLTLWQLEVAAGASLEGNAPAAVKILRPV